MDFIFKDVSVLDTNVLKQGDVIERKNEVESRIREAHQYYADAPDYTHFVVLTQSCDLVKRQNQFKAPYITVAAAKPFKNTIDDFLNGEKKNIHGADFSYLLNSRIKKVKQLLERHINNTEPEYFFLPQSGHPNLSEDLVVFLRLTIAMRKDHYDAIAGAKIAELADVFQAKLGWLKGNIYSRVATPDIEEQDRSSSDIKSKFYDKYIPKNNVVCLSALQAELLRKKINAKKELHKRDLTNEEAITIIEQEIPEDIDIVANKIVEKLIKKNLFDDLDEDTIERIKKVISNEATFKSIIKSTN